MKRDQELEVVIGDIGSEGDGIAIMQGYRVFVPEPRWKNVSGLELYRSAVDLQSRKD